MEPDLGRLCEALVEVEAAAARQDWADGRPWRAATHVWSEGRLVVVDLHDLGVGLALDAVRASARQAPALASGAVCFVTGVGRHSLGPARLPRAVSGELDRIAREHGWQWRPLRRGRVVLVADPARAPAVATGRLGWPFWLLVAVLVAAAAYACLGAPPLR